MSAASALGYLALASARGRARQLARRVRSPRHFFGMLVGVAWLLFVFSTNRLPGRVLDPEGPLGAFDAAWLVELLALAVLVLGTLASWLFVREGAGLGFSEPEINLLFPAPLGRRHLVAYKLAQAALGMLVVVVLLASLLGRGGVAQRASYAIGGWLALVTASLHGVGATLTRASLAQHGVAALRRRLLTLVVAAAVPVAAAVGWWRAPALEAFPEGLAGFTEWTRALLDTAPLSWALYPLRVSLDAAFASSAGAFRAALPGALVVLALHVAWVFSTDAAFEEAAVERARKLTARLEAVRSGAIPLGRRMRRRRSFALHADGNPAVALAWKAAARATRVLSIPVVASGLAVGISLVVAVLVGRGDDPRGGAAGLVAAFALLFFVTAALFGPFVFSGDLRRDAPYLEVLRALPLRGRQVLVGEIAVPFVQVTAAQWLFVAVWYACAASPFPRDLVERLAFALAMAIGGPAVSAAALVVANGLVVLYPDWAARPEGGPSPLERFGPQSVAGVVTSLLSGLALVPAALVGGLVAFVAWPVLGSWAVTCGAVAGAATIATGAAVALALLGRAFERLDASA